jgi:hypothetical protein
MKKLLIILFFLALSLIVRATTYYVATTGSDSNNGSIGSPFLHLHRACEVATVDRDIIHVEAGTFTETEQSILAVGVSIEGHGVSSIIHSHYSTGALISGEAPSTEGTNGNQSISYLYFDGDNLTGDAAIKIGYRSNVLVHHCTIINFYDNAVYFYACYGGEPTIWATGNKIYDNIINNCGPCENGGTLLGSNVSFGGQSGMEIYNNDIYQPDRGPNITGEALSYCRGGWAKGMKIYNNSIIVDPSPGSLWSGVAEFFECKGGMEIYNNTISGTLDFSCNIPGENGSYADYALTDEGGYGFALKIYNNNMLYSVPRNRQESAIDIERNTTGRIEIFNNHFENLYRAIRFSYMPGLPGNSLTKDNVWIYYNTFTDIGIPDDQWGAGDAISIGSAPGDIADNFNIFNNTITAGSITPNGNAGISSWHGGAFTNWTIKNNIIVGFDAAIYFQSVEIDGMVIENNNFYGNDNNSVVYYLGSQANLTVDTPSTTQPPLVSSTDFHLTSSFNGAYIGVTTTDKDGNVIGNPPDMGAYEYGGTPPTEILVTSITVSGAGGATTISVDDGTLQMSVAVLPVNADDKTVTWSVIDGSGTATINSTGLLTALTNGSVTVRAIANDGSGVYGTRVITISNQVVVPLVSSITVSGTGGATTISTNDGTLQMLTSVLPSGANQVVAWSVVSGGTYGSISIGGLLTALGNGSVTVRATATDGSGVYDDQVIVISNQVDTKTVLQYGGSVITSGGSVIVIIR